MLGHAGGWDELLLAASAVLALIVVQAARRRAATAPPAPARGPCAYCGTLVEPGDRRCSGCGFRARVEEAP